MKMNMAMLVAGASYLYVSQATGRVMGSMRVGAGSPGQEEVGIELPKGVMAVKNPGLTQVEGRSVLDLDGIDAKDKEAVQKAIDAHVQSKGSAREKAQAARDAEAARTAEKPVETKAVAVEDKTS